MKSWIAESDFLFRDARVPRGNPQFIYRRQSGKTKTPVLLVRHRNQGINHRVNTLFTSLDKVLAEIEDLFSGNDQVVLCDYYNFDKKLLSSRRPTPVQSFQKTHVQKSIKLTVDVINVLYENTPGGLLPNMGYIGMCGPKG